MRTRVAVWRVACAAALGGLCGIPVLAGGQAAGSGPAVPSAIPSPSDSALDAQTAEVASHLRCPVCQGLSIQDSPSQLAQQMRSLVHDQLVAGKTPNEVRNYFVARYGEWILLEPRPSGFNILAYALPVAGLLGGLALIVVAVRRWTQHPATPG